MSKRKILTAIPGPKSQELHRLRQENVSAGVFSLLPIYAESGDGAILVDVDGNHLIDMGCGIGVTTLGHTNKEVVAAAKAQLDKLSHTLFANTPYEVYIRVCQELAKVTPGSFAKKSILLNSGAEAVENAIKIARAYTGKTWVAALDYSFHGRTNLTAAMSYKGALYSHRFGPAASNIAFAPNSYPLRDGLSGEAAAERTIAYLEARVGVRDLACFIFEPVQGEGGFIIPAEGYLPRLQQWCRDNNVVFIADEIQSGFGRTGKLFASEWDGLEPDLVCSAKGIANGLPLSAVTGRAEIMDSPGPATLGGTFGGNYVSCAAALAVFEQYRRGGQLESALRLGSTLEKLLKELQAKYPQIAEVRGRGAMMAVEFLDPDTRKPLSALAIETVKRAAAAGVIFLPSGVDSNVIRFLPNILMDDETLTEAISVLDEAIAAA